MWNLLAYENPDLIDYEAGKRELALPFTPFYHGGKLL